VEQREKKEMQMAWMHTAKKTTLPNKLNTGYHETTEEEGDSGTLGKQTRVRNGDSRIQVQLEEYS